MATRGLITSGRLLAAAVVVSLVCAFLPMRMLGWVTPVSGVVIRLVAPVSSLGKWLSDQASRAEREAHPDAELGRFEELESLVRGQQMEIAELRATLDALEQGDVLPEARVRQLAGRVFATAASRAERTLLVRRGSADGVTLGSVAVVRGRHVLGVVSAVEPAFCVVTPTVSRDAGTLEATVFASDADTEGVRFSLTPVGDGTLRGPGQFRTVGVDQRPVEVSLGATAVLSDPAMPSHWGLFVGRVVAVDADPASPLRQVITVRPEVDTRRVARAVIRVPESGNAGAGDASGAGP
ncbi:MAG: rod shape-determining protein MreC [Planctomycetota bacterium]